MKAAGAAIGIAAIATFVKSAVGAASDVSESMSKVKVVFGDSSAAVIDWSKNAATAMGQSQGQALGAVGTFGNLLKGFGIGNEQTVQMSESMVQLATDMASFNNTSVDEALGALQSGLTGETEPLKKFGVALNDAAIKAEAVKLGLIATTNDALNPAQKAQASYSLILANTTTAQGDFARTSGGLANQQKILAAKFDDVKAKLGAVLLPLFTKFATFLSGNMKPVLIAIGVVLGILFVAWVAGAVAAAAATLVAAAPFIAIGVAIAAVAAGVIYAYNHFTAFKNVIDTVVEVLKVIWAFISANILPILQAIAEIYIAAVITYFKFLWAVIVTVIDIFKVIYSFIADNIIPIFMAIAETIISVGATVAEIVGKIVAVITGIGGRIAAFVATMWDGLKNGITAAKDWVSARIDEVVGFVTGIGSRIAGFVSTMWDAFKTAITGAKDWVSTKIDEVVGFVTGIPGRISSGVSDIFGGIKTSIDDARQWVWEKIEEVVGWATALPGRMSGLFGGMWDGIKNAFKSAINAIIRGWNGLQFTMPSIDTHIPGVGTIGGFTVGVPDIPQIHTGGIIPGSGNVPAVLLGGEMVLTAAQQAELFAQANGRGGASATPSVVVNNNRRDLTPYDLAQAIQITRLQVA